MLPWHGAKPKGVSEACIRIGQHRTTTALGGPPNPLSTLFVAVRLVTGSMTKHPNYMVIYGDLS